MAAGGMWVFCSGMMRSGSTLQYQIAKALVEGAGEGEGVGFCVPGRFRELLRRYDDPRRTYVVKTHRYLPSARSRLRRGEARSIYIHRDLRDVVVSRMHKEHETFRQAMAAGIVEQLLEDDAIWSGLPATLVSAYDDMMADLPREVARIAAFLGIEVPGGEIERIASAYALARQQRRVERFDFGRRGVAQGHRNLVDPETLLHHNHVRSGETGQWTEELTPAEVAEVERVAGEWLVRRGYRLSESAGAGAGTAWRFRLRRWKASKARLRVDAAFHLAPRVTVVKAAALAPVRWISAGLTSVRTAVVVGGPAYALSGRRRASGGAELAGAERVLVVRVDAVGDVVLTSPLLRELRRNLPAAEITLVVRPAVRDLVEHCPYVDRVHTYDWAVGGLLRRVRRHGRALALARRELWPRRLDLALRPRWGRDLSQDVFLMYFSGAANRVAYSGGADGQGRRDADSDRLLTRALDGPPVRHEVERNLDVLRALGGTIESDALELWIDDADAAAVARLLERHRVRPDEVLVALAIGASKRRRAWPLPRFVEIARRLGERHGARCVLLGGEGDRALGEGVARQTGDEVVDLTGETTLRQAGALLRRCRLYVGNDTGVMHLAAAAGTSIVEISCHPRSGSADHPNSPARFGPRGVPHRVVRPESPMPPCTDGCTAGIAHCITAVTVERVEKEAAELLPLAREAFDRAMTAGRSSTATE